MKYPYFRGLEADRYSFYRVPKALIKVDLFEKMSGDAKLLYAVLLDRMNLSLKNGWQDENGNAYIICTIDEIMDSIRCARQKAVKLLDELEHEYQLIERRRQGLGKPNLLYVKDLYLKTENWWALLSAADPWHGGWTMVIRWKLIACVRMERRTLAVFCTRRHTVQHGPWATTKLLPTFWTRRMAAP